MRNTSVILLTRWTEWDIDLEAFADQGVDLTNINTITIGFGMKNSPGMGGSGKMYFDDIRIRSAPLRTGSTTEQ